MKTDNQSNFELVKSCFEAFCYANQLTPYVNSVMWEHEGFSCSAHTEDEDYHFRAVDACCPVCDSCDGRTSCDNCAGCDDPGLDEDPCPVYGRNNQIDFERV